MERNDHHALWTRRSIQAPLGKTCRNLLVVRGVLVSDHDELHASLSLPPKLGHNSLAGLAQELSDRPMQGQFDPLLYAIDYLNGVEANDAQRLALHLTKQLGFLGMEGGPGEA